MNRTTPICMMEIATDLGDRDKRTTVGGGDGATYLDLGTSGPQFNPSLCLNTGQISAESPSFWCGPSEVGCTPPAREFAGEAGRGAMWSSAWTILPPIRESCGNNWHDEPGALGASSRHWGGAHVLMGDGAVVFITDSIEAGGQRAPSIMYSNKPGRKSPYGLWGALGTRAGKEKIEEQLNQ